MSDLSLPQQAGILCNDARFVAWLREAIGTDLDAADWLRRACAVGSRAELRPDNEAGRHFLRIRAQFHAWTRVG